MNEKEYITEMAQKEFDKLNSEDDRDEQADEGAADD